MTRPNLNTARHRVFLWLSAAATVLLLNGCAAVTLFNALIPEGELTATRDIAYGTNPRQKLDVY